MKNFKHLLIGYCMILVATYVGAKAQVPDYEGIIGLTDIPSRALNAAASDGYGQHVVINDNNHVKYFLFGNDGITIHSQELQLPTGHVSNYSTITSFGGKVTVVVEAHFLTSPFQPYIDLFQSSDGGATWPIQSTYQPNTGVDVSLIDATSNGIGVHIAWDNGNNEVYYVQYNSIQGQFIEFKPITDFASGFGITGFAPKVLTSGSKVIVSFVGSNPSSSNSSCMTRDGSFSGDSIAWDSSPRVASVSNVNLVRQDIGIRGTQIYMLMVANTASGHLYRTERTVSSSTWGTVEDLGSYGAAPEPENYRRRMTTLGDTLHMTYNVNATIWYNAHRSTTFWFEPPFNVQTASTVNSPTISSSRTGAYVLWASGSNANHWMRRTKVYALSGHITENMYFTGKNWITDDLTIDSTYTVTLKAGSITYVSDNKKLIVARGATLKKERGSQIIFGSGATFKITTSLIDQWNMTGIPDSVPNFWKGAVYPNRTPGSSVFYVNSTGYVASDTVSNDRGWWVKFSGAQPQTYEGGFIDSMAMIAYNGWNIIGSISSPINVADVFSKPTNHIITPFYKYDNGYAVVTTLVPGAGYWVKTDTVARIILTLRNIQSGSRGVPGPLSKLNGDEASLFDTYDQFTITDAAGGRQHLFVRSAVLAGTTENFEMPPPALDNAFDVRFSPGQYLQSVTPDSEGVDLSIALNSVTYPVELSWNINPDNGLTYTLPEGGGGLGKRNSLSRSKRMILQNRGDGFVHFNVSNRKVQENELPAQFSLQQNYPNPFNPSTVISYDLPMDAHVALKVYDVLGREVMTLVNGVVEAGYHQTILNATNLASGLYFYRLQAGAYTNVRKLMVLK